MKYALLLPLLVVACGPSKDDSDSSSSEETIITDVSATVSETIGTVITVTWSTDVPSVGQVRFGPELVHETPLESTSGTAHSAILIGSPAETEVPFEIVAQTDDGSSYTYDSSATTSYLTNTLPEISMTGGGHDLYTVTTLLGGNATGPAIIDSNGEIVWFYPDTRGLQIFRTRLSLDGRSIIYNAAQVSGGPSKDTALVKVALDGSSTEVISVPLLAHDFIEKPDGTLAAIVVEFRDKVMGDKIMEIAPDGTTTDVWTTWDCFDPTTQPGDDPEIGWTFANALDYDPNADRYAISIRNFSTIVQVNPSTRECEWAFGTTGATFGPSKDSSTFMHEHQFEILDDSIIVFDNAGAGGNKSRAIEYSFDPASKTAKEIWSYVADPPIFTFVLGDVARMDNGDTLVDWAVGGRIDRVTPAGAIGWQIAMPIGSAFGFAEYEASLYR